VELGIIQVPEGRKIFPKISVKENLELGAFVLRARKVYKESIDRVYAMFPKLREREIQLAETLSGGEQQMLAIGRALMSLPSLLMLDEPSLGLAPLIVKHIFEIIKSVNESGVSILLVEQNIRQTLSIANYGYILENGRIVLENQCKNLIRDENIKKAYLGYSGGRRWKK
jgi:branched-chain amino acid transport system ATP-binding protein